MAQINEMIWCIVGAMWVATVLSLCFSYLSDWEMEPESQDQAAAAGERRRAIRLACNPRQVSGWMVELKGRDLFGPMVKKDEDRQDWAVIQAAKEKFVAYRFDERVDRAFR